MKIAAFFQWAGPMAVASVCLTSMSPAQVRITEVNVSARTVELTNFGSTAVDLTAWRWCHRFTYSSPGGSIAAGQTKQYSLTFNQTSSDIGLYNSSSFASSTAMQDFVQFGGTAIGRESVAIAKGIWAASQALTVPASGLSFHAKSAAPMGSRFSDWFVGRPHLGWPVPSPVIESLTLVGSEWRVTLSAYHLAPALGVEVNASLLPQWQALVPTKMDLTGGRFLFAFPQTGARQFARITWTP
jgi:hypothetical protein